MGQGRLLDALVGDTEIAEHFTDARDLAAMLAFETALAAAQAESGLIPTAAATAVAEACRDFQPDWEGLRAGMTTDGVVGPALVAALRASLDEPHRQWLHFCATSQDMVDTSLAVRLNSVVAVLGGRLATVIAALHALRQSQGALELMGHTRMQAALPITVADKVDAWTWPLERHAQRLAELLPRLLVVQFGGPVGTRAGLDGNGAEIAAGLAARLGLATAPCWHTGRDGIVEFGQWLALLCGSLGKIGQDVALLAQTERGAVQLAAGGRSSSMPNKTNPIAAEVLIALARFAAGHAGALAHALVAENERSGAAWTLEWLLLPPLAEATGAALRHASEMLSGLRFVGRAGETTIAV